MKMSKNVCEKVRKQVKLGENPNTPYPQYRRSIKSLFSKKDIAPSITKYGFLVRPMPK